MKTTTGTMEMLNDRKKEDLHHYEGTTGRACVVYLLKAYEDSARPNWEYEFNECDNPNHQYEDGTYEFPQYALGVYSKGEWKEAEAHGKRHTKRTGEKYGIMETFLTL